MDKQFEGDVMQDLMDDSPALSADDAFEDAAGEGFEEDSMEEEAMLKGMEGMDGFDEAEESYMGEEGFDDGFEAEMGDEFIEEGVDAMDALEEAVADALDAEDSDEFLRRLIGGIRNVAGVVGRGAGTVRRAAGTAQRVAGQVGRVARGVEGLAGSLGGGPRRRPAGQRGAPGSAGVPAGALQNLLQQLLPLLRQSVAQGADEMDLFEDLSDFFEEEDADEALPVIAGVAARAALRPLVRRGASAVGQAVRRQLVRGTTQAARTLVNRQGPRAIRALRPIARSVGRTAARRGLRPAALPTAIRQTATRVAAQPQLARSLSQPTAQTGRARSIRSRLVMRGGTPRRFVVSGPVEIIVRR